MFVATICMHGIRAEAPRVTFVDLLPEAYRS